MKRPTKVVLLAILLLGAPALSSADTKLSWEHEGYAALLEAAAVAKAENRRLLIGLSGGKT